MILDVCETALARYGATSRFHMLVEEIFELLDSVHGVREGTATLEEFFEEVADVRIMTRQVQILCKDLVEEKKPKRGRPPNPPSTKKAVGDLTIELTRLGVLVPRIYRRRASLTDLAVQNERAISALEVVCKAWPVETEAAYERKLARLRERLEGQSEL